MRFFYFYPSYASPSGGNKQLRLQGSLLAELGHEVFLLRDQKFFDDPAQYQDDYLYGASLPVWEGPMERVLMSFHKDDFLVLPEGKLDSVLPMSVSTPARIVINNQNGFYALRYFPESRALCNRIDAVIANSPYNCMASRVAYRIPAERLFYVPHWVVRGHFEIAEQTAKLQGICYMPRKQPELVNTIKQKVQQLVPEVPWVEIDRVPEPVVAERLRAHSMFFAAQHLEGCPLTALEAMACRCLVAGFPGTEFFTHPYANDTNGYWAMDNDVDSAVRAICRMVRDTQTNPGKCQETIDCGIKTVGKYTKEQVVAKLSRLVDGLEAILSNRKIRPVASHRSVENIPEESWNWSDYLYAQRKKFHYNRLTGFPAPILRWVSKSFRKPSPSAQELSR
jgi:glycosyltransferase involved in cell wall biosynthesis